MPPFPPPLTGAQQRVYNVTAGLAKHYQVVLICPERAEYPTAPSALCSELGIQEYIGVPFSSNRGYSRWAGAVTTAAALLPRAVPAHIEESIPMPLLHTIQELHMKSPFDAVWAFRSWSAELAKRAGLRSIIADIDDFESRIWAQEISSLGSYGRKPLHVHLAKRLAKYEERLHQRFSAAVVVKEEDRVLMTKEANCRIFCVPNGAAIPDEGSLIRTSVSAPSALFVGTLNYQPNIDSITWFAGEILPKLLELHPMLKFIVVGKGRLPATASWVNDHPQVVIHESPATLLPYYNSATVAVAPIRTGAGTRIKVLEALAHKCPLVATSEAVAGINLTNGVHFTRADDVQAFVEACSRIVQNRQLQLDLGEAGYNWVSRFASWARAGDDAAAAVSAVLAKGNEV
ncbi:glycosyltransferase family 4 protein [Gemmatimonas phototrophica]|uniref:glycosyltransferase family 4 protein n=1 Tax=Gemmatimonas phototrophica TaxID=1379270 RepID=UPI0009EE3978|nr:glycosyltransferase family 4 protein [Gemmatimonas phototrophica]